MAPPSLPRMEVSPPAKMPAGFNVDDFLFSKLYKSVNVEGRRTINEVLQAIFLQRIGEDAPAYCVCTVNQFLELNLSKNKIKNIISKLDVGLLEEKLVDAEFDVTCGIRLLQKAFPDEYRKLSGHCQAQIHTFKEFRNSLSHNYPLVHHDSEPHDEKLRLILEKNKDLNILLNEIKKLEDKKSGMNAGDELNQIHECITEKKKEKYVIIEIEKLKVILNDILEGVGRIFQVDFTKCKTTIDKNLTDISKAKVQQYDQDTYDKEVERFKRDPLHELITKAREDLKHQYKKLRVANPCPWMIWDEAEKSSLVNFYIDKIYTPLKIEGPKKEICTEELLKASKDFRGKKLLPPALVCSGQAGSGKTSLCLFLLHHWTEGTQTIELLKDYNLVIFVEMRTVRSDSIEGYLKTQRMKKSTSDISSHDLVQRLDNLKLLFIIDGYDEGKKASQKIVEDIFAKFPDQRILVTTRGEFCNEVQRIATKHHVEYLTMEICGFDGDRMEEFTEKVFKVINKSRDSAIFLEYARERGRILDTLLELPLTLALMIYLWIDCPHTLSRVTNCTSLYYELFCLYQKKLKDRLQKSMPDSIIEKLLLFLGKKAWDLLLNEESILSEEDERDIEEQCVREKVPTEEVMSAFLVHESDENADEHRYDYFFKHKTLMEYLSAYFLAEETAKKSLHDAIEPFAAMSRFYQVILFLVGHFARKQIIEPNLRELFELFHEADIKKDDYNFCWKLLTESQNNKQFLLQICRNLLHQEKWKLSQTNVVSGLELLIARPNPIKELIIEIENGTDPYDIKHFYDIMVTLRGRLGNKYNKYKPLLTELFFWQHYQAKCTEPSDKLLRTLYPWGHLRDFTGSVGQQSNGQEVLNYCYRVKNLRVRVDSPGAQICLANSLKRIISSVRQLRVMLVLNPEECDPNSLACLTQGRCKASLELTLPNMNDENKKWIVEMVKQLSGDHGCSRLFLEKSTLSFSTVLYIMEKLREVLQEKLTVESTSELTDKQMIDLEKQEKSTHMDVKWM